VVEVGALNPLRESPQYLGNGSFVSSESASAQGRRMPPSDAGCLYPTLTRDRSAARSWLVIDE